MWVKNSEGITLEDTANILKEVEQAYVDIFPNLNLDPSTPQGQIIAWQTRLLTSVQDMVIELANVFTQGGSGTYLDIRNQTLFGITRKPPVKSTVDITIGGMPLTNIPSGFTVSDSNNENKFILEESVNIGVNKSVTVTFVAIEEGNIQVGENTLTTIQTPVIGVETVTNPSVSTVGQLQETDAEFYKRATDSLYFQSTGTYNSTLARINNLNGVERVGGYENFTSQPIVVKNIEFPPHSASFIVYGGDAQDIAYEIFISRNPGSDMSGDTQVIIQDDISKQNYNIEFYRANTKQLYVVATVKTRPTDNTNYQEVLYNAIEKYLLEISIGGDLYPLAMLNDLGDLGFVISDLKAGTTKGSESYSLVEIDYIDLLEITQSNIEIISE